MENLGHTLREARRAAGQSLSGMARRTGYARSYLGNVETGKRQVTPGVIRAYERVLGDDVKRRDLFFGAFSTVVAAIAVPDVATDIAREVSAERHGLLATVQTSHEVDHAIASLVSRQRPSIALLMKWTRSGSPVLRVNAAGILAKVGFPALDDVVTNAIGGDPEVRDRYLTAVVSRVLGVPWDEATRIAADVRPSAHVGRLDAFVAEARNGRDSGARLCSVVMLARARPEVPEMVNAALVRALRGERSVGNLRAVGYALAGRDPLSPVEES